MLHSYKFPKETPRSRAEWELGSYGFHYDFKRDHFEGYVTYEEACNILEREPIDGISGKIMFTLYRHDATIDIDYEYEADTPEKVVEQEFQIIENEIKAILEEL